LSATQHLEEARAAAAGLPERQRALEARQRARTQILGLADCQAELGRLDIEADRIHKRLAQRAQLTQRANRLEGELDEMRRQRRDLSAQIQQLSPLAGELEASRARLAGLGALSRAVDEIQQQRRALEQFEATAADRAEADARVLEAQAEFAEARATLATQEALRVAAEERGRAERAKAALEAWTEHHASLDAAQRSRRLLDDLALAMAGGEHVAVRAAGVDATGLRRTLLLDHPLTGAAHVQLRLWAGGAELIESRAASDEEARGLKAGGLPALGATDDGAIQAALRTAVRLLVDLGEPAPKSPARAARRLAEIDAALAAPTPAFDAETHLQARANAATAERRLADVERAAAALPEASAIARDAERTRRQTVGLERAVVADATRLQILAPDVEAIQRAIPHAVADEQQRRDQLAGSLGRLEGLAGQLRAIDQSGGERKRELAECRQDLSSDSETDLLARQRQIAGEAAAALAQARQLLQALDSAAFTRDLLSQVSGHVDALQPAGAVAAMVGSAATMDGAAPHAAILTANGAAARESVRAVISALNLVPLRDTIQHAVEEARDAVAILNDQAKALPAYEKRVAAAEAAVHEHEATLATSLQSAAGGDHASDGPVDEGIADPTQEPAGDVGARVPDSSQPAVPETDPQARAESRLAELQTEMAHFDPAALRADENDTPRAVGAALSDVTRGLDDGRVLVAALAGILEELGHAAADGEVLDNLEPGPAAARIREICPEAAGELPERDVTEARLRDFDQRVGNLKGRQEDALLVLGAGAPDDAPDLDAAREALEALERDLAARKRAQEIVAKTRQRMIEKVLPDTITNMCLLVPQLTAGRYRYAELTPDYRLQVWDERKHGYVEKNLYSGGTQDQFSLALRLGFALAALPRELGTSPGFLFLDEPLSSFDHDRTAALVDLLTHGQIATFFQQVFLISHSKAFDPHLFTHHIVMEDGQIAESTLPKPVESAS
jgi:hypothetical protein